MCLLQYPTNRAQFHIISYPTRSQRTFVRYLRKSSYDTITSEGEACNVIETRFEHETRRRRDRGKRVPSIGKVRSRFQRSQWKQIGESAASREIKCKQRILRRSREQSKSQRICSDDVNVRAPKSNASPFTLSAIAPFVAKILDCYPRGR